MSNDLLPCPSLLIEELNSLPGSSRVWCVYTTGTTQLYNNRKLKVLGRHWIKTKSNYVLANQFYFLNLLNVPKHTSFLLKLNMFTKLWKGYILDALKSIAFFTFVTLRAIPLCFDVINYSFWYIFALFMVPVLALWAFNHVFIFVVRHSANAVNWHMNIWTSCRKLDNSRGGDVL